MKTIHATCVIHSRSGVLLLGPSGSGKSDFCLRLISKGWRLVADDQVQIISVETKLIGRAPDTLRGLLEVRGIGIIKLPYAISAPICLTAKLMKNGLIERLPDQSFSYFCGHKVRKIEIDPFEVSAVEKLSVALEQTINNNLF